MASILAKMRTCARIPTPSPKPSYVPYNKSSAPLLKPRCLGTTAPISRPFSTHSHHSYESYSNKKSDWNPLWFLLPAALLVPTTFVYCNSVPDELEEELGETEQLYKSKGTGELAFSLFILKLCSFNPVVEYGPQLLDFAEKHYLSIPARWVVKQTFFRNFVPGETIDECKAAMDHLKETGIGVILDYSIETGNGSKEELDKVADHFMETIRIAGRDPSLAFGCLKVSGLVSFSLLERITKLVQYYNAHNLKDIPIALENNKDGMPLYARPLPPNPTIASPPPPLTPEESQELYDFMQRFDKICSFSHSKSVPMLIDAEQTYYQPAIDLFTLHMCKKYNKEQPIIYNTYQMYLRGATDRLTTDIEQAKQQNYHLGAKLVRGAYMYSERDRAKTLKYDDPIQPTIEATHKSYHEGVDIAFNNLDKVGVVVASHNENTVIKTMEKVRTMGIDPKNPNVQFAQLYGMGDHLTLLLVNNGQRVFKYVPFGPVEYVIPYLTRRMQENRGFVGSTSAKERKLLWKELTRRFSTWSPLGPGTPQPALVTGAAAAAATVSGKNLVN